MSKSIEQEEEAAIVKEISPLHFASHAFGMLLLFGRNDANVASFYQVLTNTFE